MGSPGHTKSIGSAPQWCIGTARKQLHADREALQAKVEADPTVLADRALLKDDTAKIETLEAKLSADKAAGNADAVAADKAAIDAAKAQRATDRAKLDTDVVAVLTA